MAIKANTFRNPGGKNRRAAANVPYRAKSRDADLESDGLSEGKNKALKVLGVFLLFVSFVFAVSFVSYLFTWKQDQSYISKSNGGWATLFKSAEEIEEAGAEMPIVENKLGKLGALLANQFIYEWFGMASFLFIPVLFVVGYRFLYGKSLLPVRKTTVYASTGIIFLSVTLGFLQDFFTDSPHILEGKFGYWTNRLLTVQIGTAGVAGLLVFAYLTALILVYNVDLRVSWVAKKVPERKPMDDFEDEDIGQKNRPAYQKNSFREDPDEESDFEAEDEKNVAKSAGPSFDFTVENAEEEETDDADFPAIAAAQAETAGCAVSLSIDTTIGAADEEEGKLPLRIEGAVEEKTASAEDLVAQFGEYDPKLDLSDYRHPHLDLLTNHGSGKITINQQELEANKDKIVDTLGHYNVEIQHIKATIGPTVTLYEIIPKPGVRISKIKNLEDDIALSLAALGIRIIAPMPGKGTIGIEVPNGSPEMVSMRSVLATEKFQKSSMDLPIALGRTISNEVYIADLAKMPHLLVAGATGQGKSVGINAILTSLLYKKHPAELKFVLVDPKKVELSLFKKIERHFLAKLPDEEEAIITDTKKVINTLNSLCIEMDQRYDLLKNGQVRNLKEYNAKFVGRRLNPEEGHRFLPFIVLVVDEFADLMMTAGKEVEMPIARLAQLARAVGIHLVIATQRPSVNIITGTIKANFPARLAFRVLSKVDSRTILDMGGADQLIGRGDMLLTTGSDLTRIQCAFVDTPEVELISEFIGSQRGYPSALLLPEYVDENGEGGGAADFDPAERDKHFEDAARLIVMHQQGSTSLIQRKMKLGYNRAGRIMDQLELAGIVGPFEGSKAREVLYPDEYSLEQYLETLRNQEG